MSRNGRHVIRCLGIIRRPHCGHSVSSICHSFPAPLWSRHSPLVLIARAWHPVSMRYVCISKKRLNPRHAPILALSVAAPRGALVLYPRCLSVKRVHAVPPWAYAFRWRLLSRVAHYESDTYCFISHPLSHCQGLPACASGPSFCVASPNRSRMKRTRPGRTPVRGVQGCGFTSQTHIRDPIRTMISSFQVARRRWGFQKPGKPPVGGSHIGVRLFWHVDPCWASLPVGR